MIGRLADTRLLLEVLKRCESKMAGLGGGCPSICNIHHCIGTAYWEGMVVENKLAAHCIVQTP